MVAAMGAPGAQDSQDAGSLPQQGWRLRGHAALGAELRVRAQAEFLWGGAQLQGHKEEVSSNTWGQIGKLCITTLLATLTAT